MSGPELCSKCNGLHYKNAPCIVRKPNAGSLNGRAANFQAADGSSILPPASKTRGRPRTITDMKVYKAMKQREYRARKK